MKFKKELRKMCKECKSECIGAAPCKRCRENKSSYGDLLAVVSIVVVAYLWAIAG